MKPAILMHLLALLSIHGIGTPYAAPSSLDILPRRADVVVARVPQGTTVSVNVDCNKLLDQAIGLISKYPDYTGHVVAISAGSALAYNVCTLSGGQQCHAWAGTVGSSLTIAVWFGEMVRNPQKEGAKAASLDRRGGTEWITDELESRLRSRGMIFDAVVREAGIMRRDDSGLIDHVVEVRGLRDPSSGLAADHRITARGDGFGHVQVHPALPSTSVAKRAAHGFKVSWQVVDSGIGLPIDEAYKALCKSIATDWAVRADGRDMGDYIADMYLGSSGQMRVRIIPETGGFGENYEDVNKCND